MLAPYREMSGKSCVQAVTDVRGLKGGEGGDFILWTECGSVILVSLLEMLQVSPLHHFQKFAKDSNLKVNNSYVDCL